MSWVAARDAVIRPASTWFKLQLGTYQWSVSEYYEVQTPGIRRALSLTQTGKNPGGRLCANLSPGKRSSIGA